MKTNVKKAGKIFLAIGILMLLTGLVLGFTLGTVAVPLLIWLSIPVNSAAIMLIRHK